MQTWLIINSHNFTDYFTSADQTEFPTAAPERDDFLEEEFQSRSSDAGSTSDDAEDFIEVHYHSCSLLLLSHHRYHYMI